MARKKKKQPIIVKRDKAYSLTAPADVIEVEAEYLYGIWAVVDVDDTKNWYVICQDTHYVTPQYKAFKRKLQSQFWAAYYACRYKTYKEWQDRSSLERVEERGRLHKIVTSAKAWILRLSIKQMERQLEKDKTNVST